MERAGRVEKVNQSRDERRKKNNFLPSTERDNFLGRIFSIIWVEAVTEMSEVNQCEKLFVKTEKVSIAKRGVSLGDNQCHDKIMPASSIKLKVLLE